MAILAGKHSLPSLSLGYNNDSPHFVAFQRLEDESKSVDPDSDDLTGALVKFQVADGYAHYRVSKHRPLTLQHVDFLDGYSVHPAMIRGLSVSDIRDQLRYDRRLSKLFSQS